MDSNKISVETISDCDGLGILFGENGEMRHFEKDCSSNSSTDVDIEYIAGAGININSSNAISVKAGDGLEFDQLGRLKVSVIAKDLTAGDGININSDVISAKIGTGLTIKNSSIVLDTDFTLLPIPTLTTIQTNTTTSEVKTLHAGDISNVQKGYNFNFSSTYIYNLSDGYSAPTLTPGDFNAIPIPASGVVSNALLLSNINANRTITLTLSKASSGLNVVNNKVVPSSGNDSSNYIITIIFCDAIFSGNSTNTDLTNSDVLGLTTRLKNDNILTITGITTSTSEYFWHVIPQSHGVLKGVIMDGAAPVLGAFTLVKSANVTTQSGLVVPCYFYRTNSKGAFTSNSLTFS